MAKNKNKNNNEPSKLQRWMKNETRNFDKLPKWKQRAIRRERENEERLEEEARARDMRRGTGDYHPEAIARAEAKAKQSQETSIQQYMNNLILKPPTKMYEGWEEQPYAEGFSPEGVQFSGTPGISKENVAFRDFWTDPKFPQIVKEIKSQEGKKSTKSLAVPAKIPSLDITTGAGTKTAPVPEVRPTRYSPVVWAQKPVESQTVEKTPVPVVKRPAYLLTLEGEPFSAADVSTYDQVKMMTKDNPNWIIREALPVVALPFAAAIDAMYGGVDVEVGGRVIKGLTLGGMSEEDWVYQEDPNGPQATIQMAFNLGILGYEAIRGLFAMAKTSIDPSLTQSIADDNSRRLQEAWNAVERSWDTGTAAWQRDFAKAEATPWEARRQGSAEQYEYLKQQVADTRAAEQEALNRSEKYSESASSTYHEAELSEDINERNVMFNSAIDQQMLSIEWRRKSDPMDVWGAATWQREPEQYEKFIRSAAFLELQLGRPLNVTEIRRLKDLYTNVGTEMAFQLIFDITNILPALGVISGVTDTIKNSRYAKFLKTIATDVKLTVKTGLDAIPVVRWVRKAAVSKVAQNIANAMDNLTRRMIPAYGSVPELINEIKKLEPLLLDFKAAMTLDEQAMVFEKAKTNIPGVKNWALEDFKMYADAYDPKTMTNMSEIFGNARRNVEQSTFDSLKKLHPDWDEARLTAEAERKVNDPYFTKLTTERFGHYMSEAYKENHRIFEGSTLTDDTLLGNFVKSMAILFSNVPGASNRKLNQAVFKYGRDLIGDSPFRQAIIRFAEREGLAPYLATKLEDIAGFSLDEFLTSFSRLFRGEKSNIAKMLLVDAMDYTFRTLNIFKQLWMTNVLTTPRWYITNFIDSVGRSFIYGEDTYSDIVTMIMSTQRYWDGDGPIPIPREMTTSLVHGTDEILDEVTNRLVFMDRKGELTKSRELQDLPESGLNIFAVWRREHDRLYKKALATRNVPSYQGLPEGVRNWALNRLGQNMSSPFLNAWDWINTGLFVAPYGAVADVNSAIEFTLRSRMFHRNYMKYMKEMETKFVTNLIKNNPEYSALVKDVMERINREAGGSPSKVEALVKAMIEDPKKAQNKFHSLDLPTNWMADTQMAPEKAQMFTQTVLENWGKYKEDVFKATGNAPTPEQRDAFFSKFQRNLEESYQEVVSQHAKALKTSEMDDSINPRGIPRDMPNAGDMHGSRPDMRDVRRERLEAALGVLKPRGRKVSPENIQEAFTDTIGGFSRVDVAANAGDTIKVTVTDGIPTISIGSEFWNKPRTQMIAELYDATMEAVAIREAKLLKKMGLSANQFKQTFEDFSKDPTRVFAENSNTFASIMDIMEHNEDAFRVLESMSGDKFVSIEGAKMIWRESMSSKYSYEYFSGDERALIKWLESEADKIQDVDFEYRAASVDAAAARVRLVQLSKETTSPELQRTIHLFDNQVTLTNDKLRKFASMVYPGPRRHQVGETRGMLWDMFEKVRESGFTTAAEYSRRVEKIALEEGHEAAAKYINELLPTYEEEFLRKIGLDIVWTDESKTEIFQIKNRLDPRTQTWYKGELRFDALKAYFFPGKGKASVLELATSETVPLKIEVSAKVRAATGISYDQAQAWTSMMEMHAERWMNITGGTLEEYFNRFSFQAGAESAPYIMRLEDGTYRFTLTPQGDLPTLLRQSAEVLFADMEELAKLDPIAAADFAKIQEALVRSTPINKVAPTNKVNWSSKEGIGTIPFQMDEKEFSNPLGRMSRITLGVEDFLKLTPPRPDLPSDFIRNAMKEGKAIGRPYLDVKWNKTDQVWEVVGHEGRGRSISASALGEKVFEVDIRMSNVRNNELTAKMKNAPIRPQKGSTFQGVIIPKSNKLRELPKQLISYKDLDKAARVTYRTELLTKIGDEAFRNLWNEASAILSKKFSPEMSEGIQKLKSLYKLDDEDISKLILSSYPTITKADMKRLIADINSAGLSDLADTTVIFTDLFLEYLQGGRAPEGFPMAFNRFKDWLSSEYQVMKRMNFEMSPEVEKALNGIFMEQLSSPSPKDAIKKFADDYIRSQGFDPKEINKQIREAKRAARNVMKGEAVNDIPSGELRVGAEFRMVPSLEEMSLDELDALALKNAKDAQVLPLTDEVRKAWNAFVSSRKYIQQFPAEATADPMRFMQYVKTQALNTMPDTAEVYERMAADVDFFLRDVIGAKKPYPKVADFQVNNGVRTFLRASEDVVGNFHEMKKALADFRTHLNATGGAPILDDMSKQQLLEWAPRFSSEKAKAINIATYGGEYEGRLYEGAIPYVNKIMLDYTDQSRFDLIAKNLFPFWMFPSRSLPFWAKTMVAHPELVAFYTKMQRWSNAYRSQAGAVTSDGRPLDSLDGYMPIPGTDIWVNPLAPLSFKYVLGLPEMVEEIARNSSYAGFRDEEIDPVAWSAKKLLEIGPTVGFNLPPWVLWIMKKPFGIPDSSLPKFPLTPLIPLVPRWMVYDLTQKSKFFGDIVYPEATFQEANVERRMYQNALEQMQSTTSQAEKTRIVNEVRTAVVERQGNPLWDATYKELTNQQALQAAGSYFTGYYAKPFSDSQAELYALRNELNMLKSSLNNEFQASVFKLDGDAQTRWNNYLEYLDTDESDIYRLYVQSGWVRDSQGNLVTDSAERANYLKQAIEAEQQQSAYYVGLEVAKRELDTALRKVKIGSPYEVVDAVYDNYYDKIDKLREQTSFSYDRSFGTWKPMELIEKEIRDEFYRTLLSSRPAFQEGMTWQEYQNAQIEWENRIPQLALRILGDREGGRPTTSFRDRADINAIINSLHQDQKFSEGFWSNLLAEASTPEGFRMWQIEQDDIFDALNKGWSELYWKPYWNQLGDLTGMERELFEEDFAARRPPPDTQELYNWIRERYGTRFSIDEIRKWVEGTEVLNIEQRLYAQRTEEQNLRSQVWDYLSWLGPMKDQEAMDYLQGAMYKEFEKRGVLELTGNNPLEDIMDHNELLYTGRPDILKIIVEVMEKVYSEKGVQKPTRAQLVQYVKAQDSNNQFKQLVNQEFPELIQRGSIPPYNLIQSWQKDYFMVENSRSYSYKFKHDNPTEYQYLRKYWDMKKQYGRVDPVWNMYYNMSEDKKNVPVQFTGLFDMDPNLGKDLQYEGTIEPLVTSQGTGNARRTTPRQKSKGRDGGTVTSSAGTPAELPGISPSLRRAMGSMLSREITKAMFEGQKLSSPAVEFLNQLASRHPEWKAEIKAILKMGKTP